METFLIRALQLILSLSFLVLVHELGHFIFSRIFNTRVEKFYIFFNPRFSLFRCKKFNGKWHFKFFSKNIPSRYRPKLDEDGIPITDDNGRETMEVIPDTEYQDGDWRKYPESTEWGIGWIPLGGYCKIAGMIDESMDTTAMALPAKSWEFRSKPTYQRLLIMVGGVLMNFITAISIYSMILFGWGEKYIPLENMKMGMEFSQIAIDNGFQNGDILLSADEKKLTRFDEHSFRNILNAQSVTVLRNGKITEVIIPSHFATDLIASKQGFANTLYPFVIDSVLDQSFAQQAGLIKNDSIVRINQTSICSYSDYIDVISAYRDTTVNFAVYRNGEPITITTHTDSLARIGVYAKRAADIYQTETINYGFFESIPAGISFGWNTLKGYVSDMKYVFTKEGAGQIGSFGAIGRMFPPVWNWHIFLYTTALISLILAFMNILPIPALDGGHVLFLLYEIIFRRKPNEKFMQWAQLIGMMALFMLFIYALGNDINRLFG